MTTIRITVTKLTITVGDKDNFYAVEANGKVADGLTFDEMLGLIASLTMPHKFGLHWLRDPQCREDAMAMTHQHPPTINVLSSEDGQPRCWVRSDLPGWTFTVNFDKGTQLFFGEAAHANGNRVSVARKTSVDACQVCLDAVRLLANGTDFIITEKP